MHLMQVPAAAWDTLANASSPERNPFTSHAFLSVLEDSGAACAPKYGWTPHHLLLWASDSPEARDSVEVAASQSPLSGSTGGNTSNSSSMSGSHKEQDPGPAEVPATRKLIGAVPMVCKLRHNTLWCMGCMRPNHVIPRLFCGHVALRHLGTVQVYMQRLTVPSSFCVRSMAAGCMTHPGLGSLCACL